VQILTLAGVHKFSNGGDFIDFIREILAFERWLRTNHLPATSQLLWYKLFMLCNSAGWAEWVVVENAALMAQIHLGNKASFIRYRDNLLESGLIEYRKGRKGHPNQYKLHSVIEKINGNELQPKTASQINGCNLKPQTVPQNIQFQFETPNDTPTRPQTIPKTIPEPAPLYKYKQDEKEAGRPKGTIQAKLRKQNRSHLDRC